ncbi:tetratricopeptide repeat protein [Rhodanobacter sp. AS-Z3]|uniref:tetratricopeptide repeat protein n=1 Tax=Rhodanobacter sp. AS-Z3 TaxID=3031330 RepID=UPI0024786CB4|nr:tetratricopeptide repeat protein [Rhodanobacter sp. AS-Z3]WEN15513.1 tetratricopeptide repeat protein [Rhodanobacter sp. AS-Z3]
MKHVRVLTMLASAALLFCVASSPALARKHDDAPKKEALYPNATRVEPKLDLTSERDQKSLNEGLDAVNAGDKAKAQEVLQPIIDKSKSKYAQALALQGLASVAYNDGDIKGAISLLQRSLAAGVMPNETFFQLEYMLAQFQLADEQYQASLDTIAKWRAEGKRETADSYALEGNAYYRLAKYPEAIAAITKAKSLTTKAEPTWDQILMASYAESGQDEKAAELATSQYSANPDDPSALNNAVAVLMQAHKYPEAIAMMEKARAAGHLTKDTHYINLAKLYLITGQESADPGPNAQKATAVLEEGISKGVLQPSADTYVLLGQAAEIGNNIDKAIGYYNKAQPLATDGEPALRAARLMLSESKYQQAKTLAQTALSKGVKQKGTAYMVLAESERAMKNKPAAIAAMKKAAEDPETAAKAKAWLKKTGAG